MIYDIICCKLLKFNLLVAVDINQAEDEQERKVDLSFTEKVLNYG